MRVLIDTNIALTYLSGREDTITANKKDFKGVSTIPALTPKEFLALGTFAE